MPANKEKKIADDNQKEIIRKKFSGKVVSHQGDKTIIVQVDFVKAHPKYKKRYTVSRRYQVHDENNRCKTGQSVSFIECRPLSKTKRWRIIES